MLGTTHPFLTSSVFTHFRYIFVDPTHFRQRPITLSCGMIRPLLLRLLGHLGVSAVESGLVDTVMAMAGLSISSRTGFTPNNCIRGWSVEWLVLEALKTKSLLVGFELQPYKIEYLDGSATKVFSPNCLHHFEKNTLYIPRLENFDYVDFILFGSTKPKAELIDEKALRSPEENLNKVLKSEPILIAGQITLSSPTEHKKSLKFFKKGFHSFFMKTNKSKSLNKFNLVFLTHSKYALSDPIVNEHFGFSVHIKSFEPYLQRVCPAYNRNGFSKTSGFDSPSFVTFVQDFGAINAPNKATKKAAATQAPTDHTRTSAGMVMRTFCTFVF